MLKKQLVIGGIAIAVVAALFALPRIVIDNEGQDNNLESRQDATAIAEAGVAEGTPHLPEVSDEVQAQFAVLRKNYRSNENTEKSTIFADSLIAAYEKADWYDSAAYYAGQVAATSGNPKYQQKALDLYYQSFTLALDGAQAKARGEQVRSYGEAVLNEEPANLEAKSMVAMTYLATDDPMKGIQMLREVVAEDEDHELAQYNLGLLSVQSGQHKKAIDRFEKVISINPDHLQAQFFLGVSYAEAGKKKKARQQFERIKTLSDDPEIRANADNYLSKL